MSYGQLTRQGKIGTEKSPRVEGSDFGLFATRGPGLQTSCLNFQASTEIRQIKCRWSLAAQMKAIQQVRGTSGIGPICNSVVDKYHFVFKLADWNPPVLSKHRSFARVRAGTSPETSLGMRSNAEFLHLVCPDTSSADYRTLFPGL